MITSIHTLIYSDDANATRAFLRDVLGWMCVAEDFDKDWLIFKSGPSELGVHPTHSEWEGKAYDFPRHLSLIHIYLQVEIDVNEADLSKISMNQKCRVSPEAYPDKIYSGHVAEIAPEADRSKGTLQIKVQIENPDKFLTPELSAKVDFLKT